jgi:hypothetical protein
MKFKAETIYNYNKGREMAKTTIVKTDSKGNVISRITIDQMGNKSYEQVQPAINNSRPSEAIQKKANSTNVLSEVSEDQLKELEGLVKGLPDTFTTLRAKINTYAGHQICGTCPGNKELAKAIVSHELYRRISKERN